jgi:hypothetical protein
MEVALMINGAVEEFWFHAWEEATLLFPGLFDLVVERLVECAASAARGVDYTRGNHKLFRLFETIYREVDPDGTKIRAALARDGVGGGR